MISDPLVSLPLRLTLHEMQLIALYYSHIRGRQHGRQIPGVVERNY